MFLKRRRLINETLSQYVNLIVQYCITNKIGDIIVGQGYLAQEGVNLGRRNNQNFAQLPFGFFITKLKSKCERYGAVCMTQEESYTSKCDHLAGEEMKHREHYLGKRIKRGLFRSSTGILINADVNGALGILLKSKREVSTEKLASSGWLTQPSRIKLEEIRALSAKNVVSYLIANNQCRAKVSA